MASSHSSREPTPAPPLKGRGESMDRSCFMKYLLFCVFGLVATAAAATQTAPQISVETLKSVTQRLSSDEFEGRAPTTPGEQKSIALISQRFKAAGLKPGNKGSWFQRVPLVETTA